MLSATLDERLTAARASFVAEAIAAIADGHTITAVAAAGGITRQHLHKLIADHHNT